MGHFFGELTSSGVKQARHDEGLLLGAAFFQGSGFGFIVYLQMFLCFC